MTREQETPFVDSASQEKEVANAYDNSQGYQPVMHVPSPAFMGSNRNVFGPMVPTTQGAFPEPETEDGYGGNAVVRSKVPRNEKNEDHDSKENKGNKKQCINGKLNNPYL